MDQKEEDKLIERQFEDLLDCSRNVFRSPKEDEANIRRAFSYAKVAHGGSRRYSGEPYILHSIAVAKIVVTEIGLGVKSIMSALLHDVVNQSEYTIEDIERNFGSNIASMVEGLTKLSGVVDNLDASVQAENFKRLILTLSDDIRVVFIKIADRLNNMRTLQYLPQKSQDKVVSETMYLYAPLAHRLGLFNIKTELEDISLKYLHPKEYAHIEQSILESKNNREITADRFMKPIVDRLNTKGYSYEWTKRVKSVYSIWRKMVTKGVPFEEVYDLYAIRIVFDPVEDMSERDQCFDIFNILTGTYEQKSDRMRNWVDHPKSNGYEALHCTLMDRESGQWVEVQIRSRRMDSVAELGFAAHWSYKASEVIKDNRDTEYEKWLGQLRGIMNDPGSDAVEFLESFQQHLQVTSMTIFTPKGDVKLMPRGATVIDFAYEIHSKIGNHAIGSKVNHRLSSLYTELHPGDQVEIITSDSASPTDEWLDHIVTAKAKNHIRQFLSRSRDVEIKAGKELFESFMEEKSIKIQDRLFIKLLPAFGQPTKDSLYVAIAKGTISKEQIFSALRSSTSTKSIKYWTLKILSLGHYSSEEKMAIAECCNPIPGDDVVGIKQGEVVTVHRKDCPNAIRYCSQHGDDIVEVKWSGENKMSFLTELEFDGMDRRGVVMDIANIIASEFNINMRDIEIHSHDGIYEGTVSFYVHNQESLKEIISKISSIKGMQHVSRKNLQ